jgi:hypothetical protein
MISKWKRAIKHPLHRLPGVDSQPSEHSARYHTQAPKAIRKLDEEWSPQQKRDVEDAFPQSIQAGEQQRDKPQISGSLVQQIEDNPPPGSRPTTPKSARKLLDHLIKRQSAASSAGTLKGARDSVLERSPDKKRSSKGSWVQAEAPPHPAANGRLSTVSDAESMPGELPLQTDAGAGDASLLQYESASGALVGGPDHETGPQDAGGRGKAGARATFATPDSQSVGEPQPNRSVFSPTAREYSNGNKSQVVAFGESLLKGQSRLRYRCPFEAFGYDTCRPKDNLNELKYACHLLRGLRGNVLTSA